MKSPLYRLLEIFCAAAILSIAFPSQTAAEGAIQTEAPGMASGDRNEGSSKLEPRVPFARRVGEVFDPHLHTGRVVVKFVEGSNQRLRGGLIGLRNGHVNRAFLDVILNHAGSGSVSRAFSRPEELLEKEKADGERLSGKELPDLNLFYYLQPAQVLKPSALNTLVQELERLPDVEIAYLEPQPAPLPREDIFPPTPNFESQQGYLEAAPYGVDARYAWTIPGGRGEGVRFIDIEYEWNLSHEDLKDPFYPAANYPCDTYPPEHEIRWDRRNHGTATVGMLVGQDNGFGITGITPNAAYTVVSESYVTETGACISNFRPDAINRASALLGPGDVIIAEMQMVVGLPQGPCGGYFGSGLAPAEVTPLVFSAIQHATANRRIVVAGAGNGSISLDDAFFDGEFDRTSENFRDSGSIIVGARARTVGGIPGGPMCFTTYGSRLDVSAWGESVVTTGYGYLSSPSPPDENQFYTQHYGGTSSATPMVAAVAVAAQGIQRARGGPIIGPLAMRELLAIDGTPQGAHQWQIGPMPDLRAMHEWMLADNDDDGMVNIDELATGRDPDEAESYAYLIAVFHLLLM